MAEYENRQRWDLDAWPEMYGTLKELQALVFLSPPGIEMNMMVFTISSLSSGCRHCQAHGAYGLNSIGMEIGKIEAIWSFEHSDLFDARERVSRLGEGQPRTPRMGPRQAHRCPARTTHRPARRRLTVPTANGIWRLDRDCHLSAHAAFDHLVHCGGGFAQWVGLVDDWRDVTGIDERDQRFEISAACLGYEARKSLTQE